MKQCTKCKALKPLTEFYKRKASRDGLSYLCKICTAIIGKPSSKAYRQRHPERLREKKCNEYRRKHAPYLLKPKTYQDCLPGGRNEKRPCPWWACPYHLAVEYVGWAWMKSRKTYGNMNEDGFIEHLAGMKETCCLDVANKGFSTLQDIADIFGCSRERIRQIEDIEGEYGKTKGAIQKLRHYKKARLLKDFTDEEPGYYDMLMGG